MDLREHTILLYCKWCPQDCKNPNKQENLGCLAPGGLQDDFLAQLQPWCQECGGAGKIDEVGGGGDNPVISKVSCPSCKGSGKQEKLDRISDEEIAKACGYMKIDKDPELRKAADAQYNLAQLVLAANVAKYEAKLAIEAEKLRSVSDLKIKYQMEKHQLEAEVEKLKGQLIKTATVKPNLAGRENTSDAGSR